MRRKLAEKIKQEFSGFKDVSIRSFFGGFSLNSESTMFGWVDQKNFYLRAHPNYRSLFIDLGMKPLNLVFDGSNKLLDYYKVGDDLLTDRKKLHDIVKIVIEYAKQDQNEKLAKTQNRLKALPNMTVSLEKLMISVDITDIQSFKRIGYLETYYRIKHKNPKLSLNILFGLYGALSGQHMALLSQELKKEIKLAYQEFLQTKQHID
ncbi:MULTISPECIES: TfoX/Sxy family DNA transformation protein [unclassified Gilliamella]|uniref:TfoX/Sxy family DNA transformation protein n=1 Tax=unclassified Gilliamella TaxID=2685620 RepID=UPI000AEE05C8|nr:MULTISPECIES: TfoX/Sxy family DNA transformation protein [unclassified Gilliamella]MBI0006217.1 TfoX/Sxy family DNA transformation protein [Gilliamella sp. W8126]MBI0037453.1 TfoX/Sxy family DNA transformation protein [Gilliamella sp. B14384G10]MBI0040616.1 TfoX/Sxy family DNA transformation protein [Gilliamella sp. B14384G7]MBI0052455.1 TfoX/Sxy family DNA transformation protein [Gilliamella sp. B14384G13]MBI0053740.1 TfoX/Sxy family DNA transformation protein [Gilliamella sp. B14384H2]